MKAKKIMHGYYSISKTGIIRREKPGHGTWVGRRLKPYEIGNHHYVKFSVQGEITQHNVENLKKRHWRK